MKINELEDLLGVSRATVRYYENQGLVAPPRTENGYRDYRDEDVLLFQKIIVLRKLAIAYDETEDAEWNEGMDLVNRDLSWKEVADGGAPGGCYVITAQDTK